MTTITVTASQITDTFTDISTILTTAMIEASTVTYTETLKETKETTVTATSTQPPPAGFTPIQISVGKNPPAKRDLARYFANSGGLVARALQRRPGENAGSGSSKGPAQWLKKVECKVQVASYAPAKTSVKTAKTTTTIAAPAQTYTVTETTTLEATSTYLPTPASTTVSTSTIVTVEETTTPSTTVTTTETVTNTVNAPQVTEYPQCNSDNYIGTDGIVNAAFVITSVTEIASAYECCVACAQQSGCEYTAFFGAGSCLLLSSQQGTCTDTFFLSQRINRYTASNGCTNARLYVA